MLLETKMKMSANLSCALGAALFSTTAAMAADTSVSRVMTHPSQGPEVVIDRAEARLAAVEDGVFVNFATNGLKAGHVHTMWFVTIANPAACATSPCTGKDVLKNTDVVVADAAFAGGAIANAEGVARFAHFQPKGALEDGWFGHGLGDIASSEIHLVIKDHGPQIEGRVDQMLATFRDGCLTESISPAFPDVAFADGQEGPNTCALVQHTAFLASEPAS